MTPEQIEEQLLALGYRCHHLQKTASGYETDAHEMCGKSHNLFLRIVVDGNTASVFVFEQRREMISFKS